MPRQTTRATVLKARALRKAPPLPEALLWSELRQVNGLKFRREHPAGPYVVDFYCPAAKLVIEIDGGAHDMGDRPTTDAQRTCWLESQGYRVVRFFAADVLKSPVDVAQAIIGICQQPQ
ncbi:endonuclease domain-containing protein [Novosphingobium sp.]|jgi:very-short-patch-repair endonuclease|uniref:endonuclease domain-containing protein n=1 Tax=Novosphingobium sp. TaxID=1874826 RepID=UPI001ECB5CEA|nr:endonuclease domain-containing protein [Novosphingobium sp.]MBK9011208.1 endonuclease domain-containing protein [Novosphingobium sp.]